MNINIESITNGNKAVGFFSVLLNGCVKNLKFENSNVEVGNSSNSIAAGTVAGAFAGSEASNINIKNSVISAKGSSTNVGGLCGSIYSSDEYYNRTNIKNVLAYDITLSAESGSRKLRGGIIGYVNEYYTSISNCYANNITFMENAAQNGNDSSGTLIGYCNGGTVRSCYYDSDDSMGFGSPANSENLSKADNGKLETPVTIGSETYDTVVDAMDAWAENNGMEPIQWDCEILGKEHNLSISYVDENYHKKSCSNCSYSISEKHTLTLENKKEATCTAEGYTGDEVCSVCNEVVKKGSVIKKLAHNYVDGKCSVCGAVDPNYNQNQSGGTSNNNSSQNTSNLNTPATGDSANMTLWLVILVVCVVVVGGSIIYMKKKK